MADLDFSVVIPAYNEAERIGSTLLKLHRYLSAGPLRYEILVVLDGPTDSTRDVVNRMRAEVAQLKIIDRPVNRGKGFTVKEGMLKAAGQLRLFTDADNSTDINHFDHMRPLFDQGCDLVIASRNARDAPGAQQTVGQAWYKQMVGRLGNLMVQAVAVPGIWDTQCGFKAFRAEAATRIFSQTTIEGWGFDIEVLALARACQYKIGIIAARWVNDDRSHVGSVDYLTVLLDTFKVRYRLLRSKYDLQAR